MSELQYFFMLFRLDIRGLDVRGLVQDCNMSTANALEILQSWTKPLMYPMLQPKFAYLSEGSDATMLNGYMHVEWSGIY